MQTHVHVVIASGWSDAEEIVGVFETEEAANVLVSVRKQIMDAKSARGYPLDYRVESLPLLRHATLELITQAATE